MVNCLLSPTSEDTHGYPFPCILAKLSANQLKAS